MSKTGDTYAQILRSSSIIGGAQGINYAIGLLRTKAVAVLLGPSGVGLVGLYVSTTGLIHTITELGISSSGVREVAEAHGSGDPERVARTVKTLRRACWVTGILGWIVTASLAYPLSLWIFGSVHYASAIALLGVVLLFSSISGGQTALLQGTRRIGELARLRVRGAVAATVIAVSLYVWLGEKGIVPVLICTAFVNLGVSWWSARKIPVQPVPLAWREAVRNSKSLLNLGVAFMYGSVLASAVTLAISALIVRQFGFDSNGIYRAAWAISGMFASSVIGAMGTDFYPRLTVAATDNIKVNRLVNEQIEVGILLALPGLLATLAFAPWVMQLLYSKEFLESATLLPWMVVGVFGQVVSYPLGFIQKAKGTAGWMFVSQSHLHLLHLTLAVVMIQAYGVVAAAWAFSISTYVHLVVVFAIARRLSNFAWTRPLGFLVLLAAAIIGAGLAVQGAFDGLAEVALGTFVTLIGCLVSLRGISSRLGANHRWVKLAAKFPGGSAACGL